MTRRILRRLLQGVLLLWALSVLSFVLAEWAPGDFLSEMRFDPTLSSDTLDTLRARYGLDEPLHRRYVRWLGSLAQGDLGFSFAHNLPVAELLAPRVRNTLLLTAAATLLAWVLALALGTVMAWHAGRWVDRLGLGGIALPLAAHDLLIGLGALLLAVETGWFPTGGLVSLDHDSLGPWARLMDRLHHLALPVGALTLCLLPSLVHHVRSAVLAGLASPSVAVARGHGVAPRRLLWAYALPLAAPPLVSLFGFSLARLLSSSFLVEIILGWPGLGPLTHGAIFARDLHVVVGVVLLSGAFMLAGNLVGDFLLYAVDPRLRDADGDAV